MEMSTSYPGERENLKKIVRPYNKINKKKNVPLLKTHIYVTNS